MAILPFELKHDFWKRPFNLSIQNLLCIEYGHLDLSRHDLGKALLFCSSKIYSALYVHMELDMSLSTSSLESGVNINPKYLTLSTYGKGAAFKTMGEQYSLNFFGLNTTQTDLVGLNVKEFCTL